MLGKHHIVANISTAVLSGSALELMTRVNGIVGDGARVVQQAIGDYMWDASWPNVGYWTAGVALFVIGSLLPDIDQQQSMLGRFVHIPVAHRTWTHSVWVLVLLGLIAWFVPVTGPFLVCLMAGIFGHDLFDALSTGGVAWLYPITNYVTTGSGGKVKRGHYIKLYRVGSVSEIVLMSVIATVAVITFGFAIWPWVATQWALLGSILP